MPPHNDKSLIVAKYMEDKDAIRDGKNYVFVTRSEGIVYKRLCKQNKKSLLLSSDNTFYKPYEIKKTEILEIWQYACSIETGEFEPDDFSEESVRGMFMELKKDIAEIKANAPRN